MLSGSMKIVVAVHHHQPIGTPHAVIEAAYRQTYAPLLQLLEQSPQGALSLHISGHLLEWLVDRHPEYIERLAALISRGQIEPLGGAHYESVLPAIPRRDRLGQIRLAAATLSRHLGVRPRGLWLPGGVWSPSLVGDLLEAGVEYTLVGSTHFLASGVAGDALGALYLTESAGESLRVFPGLSLPRCDSPFVDPRRFLAWFSRPTTVEERVPRVLTLVIGESTAAIDRTGPERVEPLPWLRGLFAELSRHGDALGATTMSHVVDLVAPVGCVDLPAGGPEELLAGARQAVVPEGPMATTCSEPLTCGVDWKSARLSEPISRSLLVRGLEISRRLADLECDLEEAGSALDQVSNRDQFEAAHRDLYRAQGDCGRWPDGETGWQQPLLRNEVFRNLVRAETRLEQLSRRQRRWSEVSVADFNLDARPEVKLANDRLVAYVSPEQGGQLYEIDVRAVACNLLSTWNSSPPVGVSAPADHLAAAADAPERATAPRPFTARGAVDHLLLP
ncbi:MAG: alpha-amylase/4-alpha-glucanotransferase domain-containing protein, partial [Planctomycetaceae bacterium]